MMETIGSERLRKAIERNRRKRSKKEVSTEASLEVHPPHSSRRSMARDIVSYRFEPQEEILYRKPQKAWSVSYLPRLRFPRSWREALMLAGWLFNLFLLFQLMFATDGLLDYRQLQDHIAHKKIEVEEAIENNRRLRDEIQKIKTSPRYQRSLAREHLGVIGPEEFLILFAREGEN